jgi:hypothetical protein
VDVRIPEVSQDKVTLFAIFCRFEFALKDCGFIRGDEGESAWADWHRFEREDCLAGLPSALSGDADVRQLLDNPPMKHLVHRGTPTWLQTYHKPLDTVRELLSAARAVRNNLFHGGKPDDAHRDDVLCRAARKVLIACLQRHDALRESFNGTA